MTALVYRPSSIVLSLWRGDCQVDYLTGLAASGIVAWTECAVSVTGDDIVSHGGLHVAEEWTAGWHIREVAYAWALQEPADCQYHHLGYLDPCDIVVCAECAVL